MTDMGTVEYLLKLYSKYQKYNIDDTITDCDYECDYDQGYDDGYYDGYYYCKLELIKHILKNRFGMNVEVMLDDRGPEYNTYRAYNSVCSVSVKGDKNEH